MSDHVETAIEQLRHLTACRCDDIWTSRNMHAPDCNHEYREYVDLLADGWVTGEERSALLAVRSTDRLIYAVDGVTPLIKVGQDGATYVPDGNKLLDEITNMMSRMAAQGFGLGRDMRALYEAQVDPEALAATHEAVLLVDKHLGSDL